MAHLNITLDEQTLKELMLGDRDEAVSKLLEAVFNAVLSAEATEQPGAESYERTDGRVTCRNGYRSRQLTTRVGTLTLYVSKFREGTFSTQLFSRYERSEQALLLSLMEMVIQWGVDPQGGKDHRNTLRDKLLKEHGVRPLRKSGSHRRSLPEPSADGHLSLRHVGCHLI